MKWISRFMAVLALLFAVPALATVSSSQVTQTDTANGATTSFSYNFLIPYQADGVTPAVQVTVVNSGTVTVLTPGQYTISGVGSPSGGAVTYPLTGSPLPSGATVTITRNYSYSQTTSVPNTGFYPHTVEQVADSLEYQIQQLGLLNSLPNGQIMIGQPSGNSAPFSISGDATLANSGILTLSAVNANIGQCGSTNAYAVPTFDAKGRATSCFSQPVGTFAFQNFTSPPPIGATTPNTGKFSSLQDTSVNGVTQCLQADATGVIFGTGVSCAGGASGSPVNADYYVSTAGSDANNGLSWVTPKLTIAAALSAASGGGTVHVGAGTYYLTAALSPHANTTIECVNGAVITQPNGQNLTILLGPSSGDIIRHCTFDGNRAGNTDGAVFMIYNANGNDVVIDDNTFQNGGGTGVQLVTALRNTISNNRFTNLATGPIGINTHNPQTTSYSKIINNYMYGPIGLHAITVENSDYNLIAGNSINTGLVQGMTVNVSGTSMTLVSAGVGGATFCNLAPGQFIIYGGSTGHYTEVSIKSIPTCSSLVTYQTMTALNNQPASGGTGDLIGISGSHNIIANNHLLGGVGGGVVISNFFDDPTVTESVQKNLITGNEINFNGEGAVEIQSISTTSPSQVFDNHIEGNRLADSGAGGNAVGPDFGGITLLDNAGNLLNTFIDGNTIRDDQGTPTTQYWLYMSGIGQSQAYIGRNMSLNTVNTGILNGLLTSDVVLSSGWGSTATVTAPGSTGHAFWFTVTANGTGISANPQVTIHPRAVSTDNPPAMICKQTGGNGAIQPVFGEEPGTLSVLNQIVFFMQATPAAGATYQFMCVGN